MWAVSEQRKYRHALYASNLDATNESALYHMLSPEVCIDIEDLYASFTLNNMHMDMTVTIFLVKIHPVKLSLFGVSF